MRLAHSNTITDYCSGPQVHGTERVAEAQMLSWQLMAAVDRFFCHEFD